MGEIAYMKLINKNEEDFSCDLSSNQTYIDTLNNRAFIDSIEELRYIEEKFYKVFDLNPCPMALADYYTHKIIDVNDAFLKLMEIEIKDYIIGKDTSDKNINLVDKDVRNKMYSVIENQETFKNILIPIQTARGKKLSGLFSGSIIELNNRKCILTICQIIDNKSYFNFFKHFLKTLL